MAPSRNTWLKRIIASLSPLSADNFHHFTASRNLADWRKSSPKNLPNVAGCFFDDGFSWWLNQPIESSPNKGEHKKIKVFSMMGWFCVFCWGCRDACERSNLMLWPGCCFEAQICRCTQGTLFFSDTTHVWHIYDWPAQVARFPKKKATWSLILLICWHFKDVKQGSGDFEDRGFSRSTWT